MKGSLLLQYVRKCKWFILSCPIIPRVFFDFSENLGAASVILIVAAAPNPPVAARPVGQNAAYCTNSAKKCLILPAHAPVRLLCCLAERATGRKTDRPVVQ